MKFIKKNELKEQNPNNRIYAIDTIKTLLIFLVVFGHCLEINLEGNNKLIYCIIYIFHIPLFAFCSGYLFKFDRKKIIIKILLPYFLFQTIYTIFNCIYLQDKSIVLNYTTPYWIMWYMMSLAFWGIFTIFFDTKNIKKEIIIVIFTFLIGIIVGLDNSVGYYLSLSRTIVFLPFFILGFYAKKWINVWEIKDKIKAIKKIIIGIVLFIIMILIVYYIYTQYKNWNVSWLYGSYPYDQINYSFVIRILQYIFSILIIIFVFWIIPNRRNFLNYIGRNTLIIYLMHGFIIKSVSKENYIKYNSNIEFLIKISILAIAIILILPLPVELIKKIKNKIENKKIAIKSNGDVDN